MENISNGIIVNKIIIGNCSEVMRTLPNDIVDLTITSPPYDNLRNYNGYSFDFEGIAKELFRITKDGGVVVWVVGDATINGSESGTSFKQALFFKECGFNLHDTMIYEKSGIPFPSSTRYNQCFEYMFVFSKGKIKTINLIKDKKNKMAGSHRDSARYRTKDGWSNPQSWKIKEFGTRNNIWRYSTGSNKSTKDKIRHPAIFPEQLAEDHIRSWSNEGDLIFDPMCGSGTTLKMALLNKRKYIGIEIDSDYANEAESRIMNCRTLLNLF